MPRRLTLPAAVLLMFLVLASGLRADAGIDDTRRARDQVRSEKAKAASQVNVLEADQAEVVAALEALQANVRGEEAALAEAQRAVAEAEAEAQRARDDLAKAKVQLVAMRDQLAARAVDAYVHPQSDTLGAILEASDASEAMQRRTIVELNQRGDRDLTDQLRALQARIEVRQRDADAATRRAQARRAEVSERLEGVKQARDEQASFAAQAEARLNAQIAQVAELAQQDRALSSKLAKEQAELQARLLAQQAAERAAAQAAAQAAAAARPTGGGGGSSISPPPVRPGGGVNLCTVGGITVHCRISSQLSAMLAAAAADGVHLSGGGYRDPSQQIELRRQHCGSSYYAIYQMSPSACSPPTARPGQSNHELGLAIDFSNCSSRGTACYQWLAGNASRFGFYNLPSEPWHWSVNGN